jgi:serine/threonine protein kinase
VIDLSTVKDDATRMLLENEKMALQTVQNPNVVQLKEIIEQDGRCYIVTELCEGETLREMILKKGRMTEEEAMSIFRKVLAGCLAITQNCVIHRDLKPANIIVSPSLDAKIIDFGFC